MFGWDDTRLGDEITHTQDIFTKAVQFGALGSGQNDAVRYALGAMLGLAAVGLRSSCSAFSPGTARHRPRPASSGRTWPR